MIKEQQRDQEERMAKELERIKLEDQRDEKMRQQIRETSLELRELEAKLKAAYMNKELAAQRAEKEAREYDLKVGSSARMINRHIADLIKRVIRR